MPRTTITYNEYGDREVTVTATVVALVAAAAPKDLTPEQTAERMVADALRPHVCSPMDWQNRFVIAESVETTTEDMISRASIIEALRDAERHDSAADAVEYVSDLVGWCADDDEILQAERAEEVNG